jgi:hypothetical protein
MECARLMIAWGHHLDRFHYDEALALFTEDGVLQGPAGKPAVGLEAIRRGLERRDVNRITRHVLSPPHIRLTGPDEAVGVADYILYEARRGEAPPPFPIAPALSVGEFRQTYRRTADGWRIANLSSISTFRQL